jgi:hypothetical protein
MFSAVFVFQKSYTGNIFRIRRNKSRSSYFSDTKTESKGETEEGQEAATGVPILGIGRNKNHFAMFFYMMKDTIGWRGLAPSRATRWWGHLAHLLTLPFRLYILLGEKTLSTRSIFQKTYCKPLPSLTPDREGLEAHPGTRPERGITTGGLLHHHACLRSDV